MVTGIKMNSDDDLVENYSWADQRLEQLYLQDQDHYQSDSLFDEDDQDDDDEDEEEVDNIHLNAYDQGRGDEDFRIICRRLFPDDDDSEETEADILSEMSVDFDLYYEGNEGEVVPLQPLLQQLPEGPPLIRANTQFQLNGVTIINGNPDGSRLFENDYDDWQPIT